MATLDREVTARVLLQQCLHARLQVTPQGEDADAKWVEIQRGMVMYVCFFRGSTKDLIPKMVSSLLNMKLSELDSGKHVSITELPGDVLIVPQATLGGKSKGRCMQYHANAGKEQGMELYAALIAQCQQELEAHPQWSEAGALLRYGTYGNRQVLKLLHGKIVIGHAIYNDYMALGYCHPKELTRDTSKIPLLNRKAGFPEKKPASLKRLAKQVLHKDIQVGHNGHCSVEDAKTTMELYRVVEAEYEKELAAGTIQH